MNISYFILLLIIGGCSAEINSLTTIKAHSVYGYSELDYNMVYTFTISVITEYNNKVFIEVAGYAMNNCPNEVSHSTGVVKCQFYGGLIGSEHSLKIYNFNLIDSIVFDTHLVYQSSLFYGLEPIIDYIGDHWLLFSIFVILLILCLYRTCNMCAKRIYIRSSSQQPIHVYDHTNPVDIELNPVSKV